MDWAKFTSPAKWPGLISNASMAIGSLANGKIWAGVNTPAIYPEI